MPLPTSRLGRLYGVLGLALLLPALAVLIQQTYYGYATEASERRAEALSAADGLLLLAEARAASDLAALRLLAGSQFFADLDVVAGARRAQDAIELIPGWTAVILSEQTSGNILFEATATEAGATGSLAQPVADHLPYGGIGGVAREGRHCPCVDLHAQVPATGRTLTALVDPQVYQMLLQRELPTGAVAAIVDRDGRFIARSIDYAQRVGTPATKYVLAAVAEGGRGIYEGTTFEGLVNYSAYATSKATGWSTHVAIDSLLLDGPRQRASVMLGAGSLTAILAALILFVIAVRDTATRRQQELKILELQRAEAVAHFTATIVHDFRNVVTALQAGLKMIRKQTDDDEIRTHVDLIEQSIGRGTRLANQLLSFSRSGEATIQANDLSEVLAGLEYLITQAVGRDVVLSIEMPDNPLSVLANRDQLELAILNLAMNAREAMNGRGNLRIETRDCGDTANLLVSDDGPGVEPSRREAIFTPFVTTKALGTGLGLAQVAGMAANAGGRAYVEDSATGGARFVVVLPKVSPGSGGGPARRAS